MKKIITLVFCATFIVGCGKIDQRIAAYTGKPADVCVNGVLYYQFTTGAAVAYNKDGTVKSCQ